MFGKLLAFWISKITLYFSSYQMEIIVLHKCEGILQGMPANAIINTLYKWSFNVNFSSPNIYRTKCITWCTKIKFIFYSGSEIHRKIVL